MLHAAAMLTGLCILWLLLTQHAATPADAAWAAATAVLVLTAAARLGGIGGAFARAPRVALIALSRAGQVLGGARAVMRAALAADITLKPALIRVKTKSSPVAQAVLADLVSAVPGIVVVDAGAEGLLAHVINEDAVDAAALARLEARVLQAAGAAP
jgi:multisubunit Na+/H+ antiporter MnhE subunit